MGQDGIEAPRWASEALAIGRHDWRMVSFDGAQAEYQWRASGTLVWRAAREWPTYDFNNGQTLGLPSRLRSLYAANSDWKERAQAEALPLDFAAADKQAVAPAVRQRRADAERLDLLQRSRMAPRAAQGDAGPLFCRQIDLEDY